MRLLFARAVPGIIAGGIAQLTMVIATIIATLQDRVVSWLYYADRIFQLPLGVIGVAIGVVLLPDLSHKLRAGDHAAAVATKNRAIAFALLLTVPAAVALFIASGPIVRVLFERGAFTAIDASATAQLLSAFALGLPAFVLIKVFQAGFFAREDTKTPMLYAVVSMAASVVASLVLFTFIGAVGIALAAALSGWLNVVLLALGLSERGALVTDPPLRRALAGIAAASVLMGLVVWGLTSFLAPWFAPEAGLLVQGSALVVLVAAGLGIYALAAELFGAMNIKSLLAALGKDGR